MRRVLTVTTVACAVVACSSLLFARTGPDTTSSEKRVVTIENVDKVDKVVPMSATGKVDKVDKPAKKFTVKTKEGEKEFTLASNAKIMAGAKVEKLDDLADKTVKVTYTVADGKYVASKVTIASEAKPDTARKEEKKTEPKK